MKCGEKKKKKLGEGNRISVEAKGYKDTGSRRKDQKNKSEPIVRQLSIMYLQEGNRTIHRQILIVCQKIINFLEPYQIC